MHIPVLLKEVLDYLAVKPGGKYIDATFGAGGHSRAIAEAGGEVLGIDWDPSPGRRPPSPFQGEGRVRVVQGNFADIGEIARENGFTEVDGILFDLGLSSEQLDDPERGFSFQKDGPLDMRMAVPVIASDSARLAERERGWEAIPSSTRLPRPEYRPRNDRIITAEDIVNHYSEKQLVQIFYEYGEERRFGKRVARAIMDARKVGSIATTAQLFDITKHAVPANLRFRAGDTARRIFQALRIAVNGELENLEKALPQAVGLLKSCHSGLEPESIQNGGLDSGFPAFAKGFGGHGRQNDKTFGARLVVISFHSLEDRIVKDFFVGEAKDCVCPVEFPVCRCEHRARLKILTRKPVTASEEEAVSNSRSKSAKLRVAERI